MGDVLNIAEWKRPKTEEDRFVGEVYLYETPEGKGYFLHRGGTFEEERDLALALRKAAEIMGYDVARRAAREGHDAASGQNGLFATAYVYHSSDIHSTLTTAVVDSGGLLWMKRRLRGVWAAWLRMAKR